MRIGIVVCTYNVQSQNLPVYIYNVLTGINIQKFDGHIDVVISDNKSSQIFLDTLGQYCQANTVGNKTFSYISYPIQTGLFNTLNLGLHLLSLKRDYDCLAYSSDDNWLQTDNCLAKAVAEFQNPSIGIVSIQANLDNSVQACSSLQFVEGGPSIILDLDEHVNLHFMIFSRVFMQAYDFRYMDALISYGTESILGFFCEAIGKKWIMSRATSVFNGKKIKSIRNKRNKRNGVTHGYFVDPEVGMSMKELLESGKSVGIGFNCWYSSLSNEKRRGLKLPSDFFVIVISF